MNPFGEDRADLRSALAGCAIVNEIRAISAGLSGVKDPKMLKVVDLMTNVDRAETAEQKLKREESERKREAAEYARRWKQDNDERLAQLKSSKSNTVAKIKQSRGRKR